MGVVDYAIANRRIVSETRGGTHRFYHADPLGSTVALYNDSQTKTDWFKYWPYGEIRDSLDVTGTPMKFIGTEGCPTQADGCTYMRAREQDPKTGRWLSVDPLWPIARSYRYSLNSSLTLRHPRGMLHASRVIGAMAGPAIAVNIISPPACAEDTGTHKLCLIMCADLICAGLKGSARELCVKACDKIWCEE